MEYVSPVATGIKEEAMRVQTELERGSSLVIPGRQTESQTRTVVHILSTSYSGSHFLSLLLGSHSQARHLGEVHRLRRRNRAQHPFCFACRERPSCPIFRDIPRDRLDQLYEVLFSRMPSEVSTLIDTSKMARGWLEQFLGDTSCTRKYIHLIRDPRALVRRWSRPQPSWQKSLSRRWRVLRAFPRRAPRLAFAPAHDILAYQWLRQNQRITRLIERHRLDAQVVTYHDLALDPTRELQRLMPWIGLSFEPEQCEYWRFEHHGTQKAEYQWVREGPVRHFDLRWQKDLPPGVQEAVIRTPEVEEYLASQSLKAGPDGLVRTASADQ